MTLPLRQPVSVGERRWRMAALIGVLVFLVLVIYAAVGMGQSSAQGGFVTVLVATSEIRPGTTISAGELGVTRIHAADDALVSTLVRDTDKSRLLGQTAVVGVASGHLVPDNVVAPQVSAALWETNLPIRRMPADLRGGDHVAMVVNGTSKAGQQIEFVIMQDVVVIGVSSGSADLWLPPNVVAQMDWYSNHGGIALVKMQPGAVQPNPPPGGGS
jgi:hypothetical protein